MIAAVGLGLVALLTAWDGDVIAAVALAIAAVMTAWIRAIERPTGCTCCDTAAMARVRAPRALLPPIRVVRSEERMRARLRAHLRASVISRRPE